VIGDDYELYGKTPMEKKAEEEARKSATGDAEDPVHHGGDDD
jgi:hypothetical protein